MDTDLKNVFDKASKKPTSTEIFAKETKRDISAEEVFAGDESLINAIENANQPAIVAQAGHAAAHAAAKLFTTTNIILIINIMVISAILVYLLLRTPTVIQTPPQQQAQTPPPTGQDLDDTQTHTSLAIDKRTADALDKATSWKLAEKYYKAADYPQAYYVFKKLSENLTTNIPADEFLKDFFTLRMALCTQNTDNKTELNALFTTALQSRSLVVQAMTNYHLIFQEARKKQYLTARKRGYKTIALLKAFEENFSPAFEADCYFMIAEALTKYMLLLSNETDSLPGKLWSDTLTMESVPYMTQNQLRSFLQMGIYQLSEGAVTPKIQKRTHLSVGQQWSAVCMDAPLEELISYFSTKAGFNVKWLDDAENVRKRPATMFLPNASEQCVTETATGSTGLIARFDGSDVVIYNPDNYENLAEHKKMIAKEAISVWRRFLLRYRGDHRTPNAHFALGLLQEQDGQYAVALGEYKLIANGYSHNPLAPFALLNASKLKTNLHDYAGARQDLKELTMRYPDTKVVDQAVLYLAEATMKDGLYADASKKFRKVYNLDLDPETQRHAAYGLGKCFYELKKHEDAKKWLTHAINLTDNVTDHRLYTAYFMLGKTDIELGKYQQASLALKNALAGEAPQEEYIQIILQLVKAEVNQQNFIVALNILENIPTEQLSQEHAVDVLLAKARIMTDIGLVETATSMLRRKVEFIADSKLRAKLSLELAKCHLDTGDYQPARKRLAGALLNLPPGQLSQQAYLLLIDVYMKLEHYDQAKTAALKLLRQKIPDQLRQKASSLLGQAYSQLGQHVKAAQAHAGIPEKFGETGK